MLFSQATPRRFTSRGAGPESGHCFLANRYASKKSTATWNIKTGVAVPVRAAVRIDGFVSQRGRSALVTVTQRRFRRLHGSSPDSWRRCRVRLARLRVSGRIIAKSGRFRRFGLKSPETGKVQVELFLLAAVRREPKQAVRLNFEKALALRSSKPLYWRQAQRRRLSCAGCNVPGCRCGRFHAASKGVNGRLSIFRQSV